MPIYRFVCRKCKVPFESTAPIGATVTTSPCCVSLGDKQFVPTAQIRITEGFRQVNRSDVCATRGTDWHPKVWPAVKK